MFLIWLTIMPKLWMSGVGNYVQLNITELPCFIYISNQCAVVNSCQIFSVTAAWSIVTVIVETHKNLNTKLQHKIKSFNIKKFRTQ